MSQLFVPGSTFWIAAVALIALLNFVFLLFLIKAYSRARSARRAQQPGPASGQGLPGSAMATGARAEEHHFTVPIDAVEPWSFPDEPSDAGAAAADGSAAGATEPTLPRELAAEVSLSAGASTMESIQDVLDAVRSRIEQDPEDSQPLKNLVRALYLDQSSFTFHSLAAMEAGDRALASALVEAWLTEAYPVDRWEDAYQATQLAFAARLS